MCTRWASVWSFGLCLEAGVRGATMNVWKLGAKGFGYTARLLEWMSATTDRASSWCVGRFLAVHRKECLAEAVKDYETRLAEDRPYEDAASVAELIIEARSRGCHGPGDVMDQRDQEDAERIAMFDAAWAEHDADQSTLPELN